MDLKPGYKLTEVGVIPEDWEVRQLVDMAEIRSGITKNSKGSINNPVWVHYLRVANVQDGFLDLSEVSKIRMNRKDIKRFAVLPGDMLMNEGGDRDKLGRGSIWHGEFSPCVHQNHVFAVRCSLALAPEYLNAWTGAVPARRYFILAGKQTTNLASINKTALGQLPIAAPARIEQVAIAGALSDADALIESLEQSIAKKRHLEQGVIQRVLTGRKRLPGFETKRGYKQTEVGEIPVDWEVLRIRDLVEQGPRNGYSGRSNDGASGTPTLSLTATSSGRLILNDATVKRLQRLIPVDSPLFLEPFDVLVQRSNTIDLVGTTAVFDGPGATYVYPDLMMRLRFKMRETGLWFWRYANSYRGRSFFRSIAAGSTGSMPKISGERLREMPLPVPPPTEQTAINGLLSDMDAEISALESKLAKARQIKQGMMQELLTGRIRLV